MSSPDEPPSSPPTVLLEKKEPLSDVSSPVEPPSDLFFPVTVQTASPTSPVEPPSEEEEEELVWLLDELFEERHSKLKKEWNRLPRDIINVLEAASEFDVYKTLKVVVKGLRLKEIRRMVYSSLRF